MFTKVLIANRGEIALRILRTLREMGIGAVAVYSDADRDARYVLEADAAYNIGPAASSESYLNQERLIQTAAASGCHAIHPGYGFLAENGAFAEAVAAAGLTFIGPSADSMRLMGDKIAARRAAAAAGVPVPPGSPGAITELRQGREFVAKHGLPILVKAGGGGGGRGIRVVETDDALASSLESASREAGTHFGNREVYLERFFTQARHIEVQVAGDVGGVVVPWGERDCSTQRRRQKLIEETPAPGLPAGDRAALLSAAEKLALACRYRGVGTVEFLYVGPGEFYFLEMNTRIQVEHTITEQVTGFDLVRESIRLSQGEAATTPIQPRGHAIEARINAEDPADNFRPGPGRLDVYREPGGPGVRIDSGVYEGFSIPGEYDSLISKVISIAPDRDQAIARLLGALRGYEIRGVPSTIGLIRAIIDSATFRSGLVTTDWLDANLSQLIGARQPPADPPPRVEPSRSLDVEVNGKRFSVKVFGAKTAAPASVGRSSGSRLPRRRSKLTEVVSPMRGTVLTVAKTAGDEVREGESLFVVEAMKMENEVKAPRSGRLKAVLVSEGDTVESYQPLAEFEA